MSWPSGHTKAAEKGRTEPLVGKRVRGDSEERTKETEQYWDKIWIRQRGLRRDTPPPPLFLTHPETVVVLSKPQIILGVLCFRLLLLQ